MKEEPLKRSSFIDSVATGTRQLASGLWGGKAAAGRLCVLELTSVLWMASTGKGTVGKRVVNPYNFGSRGQLPI